MIAIIDYGMGNIHSVRKALESCGGKVKVAQEAKDIESAEKIVLPGVGAFGDAMAELEKRKLKGVILKSIKSQVPFLGICLGLQLLFARSEENRDVKGLGVFDGAVKRFPKKEDIKIPHIGWNQLKKNGNCLLLEGVEDNSYVYFCHSYYPKPKEKALIGASTNYGIDFPALVFKGSVFGVQFHPEKSQKVGLRILKNFVEM